MRRWGSRPTSSAHRGRRPWTCSRSIRARLAVTGEVFASVGEPPVARDDATAPGGDASAVSASAFVLPVQNYHQADVISRASDVMAECARVYSPAPALAAE